jgi:hypothetical protein
MAKEVFRLQNEQVQKEKRKKKKDLKIEKKSFSSFTIEEKDNLLKVLAIRAGLIEE